jgi:membrane fusion protein, heavy metal efflux system
MTMSTRTRMLAGLGLLALLILAFIAWPHGAKPIAAEPTIAASQDTLHFGPNADQLNYLEIAPVAELVLPTLHSLPGKLTFDEDRTVRVSSPVNGRVAELLAQPGASVKAGDVLAWLDSPDFAQARADARKAQADLAMKQRALSRTSELNKLGVLSQKDLEGAVADETAARAELERADSVLKNLDPGSTDKRYALRAPIPGIVVERAINPGMQVRTDASSPLFIVSDPSRLWTTFELAEQDIGKIHDRQPLRLQVDAYPDKTFTGRIVFIGAALDPLTRRISVRGAVENTDRLLKPEMFARISPLDQSGHKVVGVPNSALVSAGLQHYVFVEETPGTLKRRGVQVGIIGDDVAYIVSGLTPNERIVTRGAVLLNAELGQAE